MFGKNWKKIETVVRSRTGSQIRSHAQKFFNKLERKFEGATESDHQRDCEARTLFEGMELLFNSVSPMGRRPVFLRRVTQPTLTTSTPPIKLIQRRNPRNFHQSRASQTQQSKLGAHIRWDSFQPSPSSRSCWRQLIAQSATTTCKRKK